MKYRIFATAFVHGELEADTPEDAWKAFKFMAASLQTPFFHIGELELDETEELEESNERSTG
jgi:hypothetical protein